MTAPNRSEVMPHDWKGDELEYCENLVKNRGSREVPAAHVASYLQLQLEDAVRDGFLQAAQQMLMLIHKWKEHGSWNPGGRI